MNIFLVVALAVAVGMRKLLNVLPLASGERAWFFDFIVT
jgi:hypothetical protein